MSAGATLVIPGWFNDGCLAVVGHDGVPADFAAPPDYPGPTGFRTYERTYVVGPGATATDCTLVSIERDASQPFSAVYSFDALTRELVEVSVECPHLDGSVSDFALRSSDGGDFDVRIEKEGKSYGRSFVVRVRNGEVVSKTYAPVRSAFTAHHQVVVKRPKGAPRHALLINSFTGDVFELMAARSPRASLDVHSVSPDQSWVLISQYERRDTQASSRHTELSLFAISSGTLAGVVEVVGGQAFVAWLGSSHLAVTVFDRRYNPTTQIFGLPDFDKVGEVNGWKSPLRVGLRDGRIWGVDDIDRPSDLISAPVTGDDAIAAHHRFGPDEFPASILPGILTVEP